ncbi:MULTISPECIES: hypothetical protein [Micromonospora]|uniref:hypothetical protein n=1 Tax=Micromonospora TaxID=1873 RepID=UPI00207C68A8|nr:hypothetical protein [Micromonospora sp. CPM1]MCO1613133.1 hypothetical protein [Micromonospora sp. CPM1]
MQWRPYGVRALHDDDFADLWDQDVWPGHMSLAEFDAAGRPNPVLMAGRFTANNGKITSYDNWSGHYQPQQYGGRMLQDIADLLAGEGADAIRDRARREGRERMELLYAHSYR